MNCVQDAFALTANVHFLGKFLWFFLKTFSVQNNTPIALYICVRKKKEINFYPSDFTSFISF